MTTSPSCWRPTPGAIPHPLAKVASGGELARSMLALRLVLSAEPPVLVFDEVDAGIGGEAALAVGRLLADLATDRQVLVVTHLPQVAAFADAQVSVRKAVDGATTTATAERLGRRRSGRRAVADAVGHPRQRAGAASGRGAAGGRSRDPPAMSGADARGARVPQEASSTIDAALRRSPATRGPLDATRRQRTSGVVDG